MDAEPPPTKQLSTVQKRVALVAVSLGTAQSAMTLSSIQIAIPELARDLQASAVMVSWIPMSFLLINAIFILPMGRYADAVGRKKIYLFGMLLFALGNLLAAFAQTIEWVLFCRAVQGLATAMMHATGMAIVASIFPDKERAVALGITASAIYFGLSLGPVFGGFLTEYAGWRSVFAVQVPLSLLNTILVMRFLNGEWKSNEPMAVDWPGTAILGVALSCLVIAVSLPVAAPFYYGQIGLVFLAVLFAYRFIRHIAHADQPLIRWHAIKHNSVFVSSLTSAFFVYAGNYTMVFLLSLYLQFLIGLSPSEAGLVVLLQTMTIALVSLVIARINFGLSERAMVALGCACVALGFLLLTMTSEQTPLAQILFALALNGLGMGMFTTPNNNLAMGSVNQQRLSSASAILNLARYLGNMLGTAIVMLLMAWLIGLNEIKPENYASLQQVVYLAFLFAMLSTAIASILAYGARQRT